MNRSRKTIPEAVEVMNEQEDKGLSGEEQCTLYWGYCISDILKLESISFMRGYIWDLGNRNSQENAMF